MKTAVILASGPSLSDEDVDYIAARCCRLDLITIVVNNSYMKAPWADALVANDHNWWRAYPEAMGFSGHKFSCGIEAYKGTSWFNTRSLGHSDGVNSTLVAMYVARDVYKVDRIILLGVDMHSRHGAHFFGKHTVSFLRNTDDDLFKRHIKQFDKFSGCEVINCTKGSDLKRFTFANLRDII